MSDIREGDGRLRVKSSIQLNPANATMTHSARVLEMTSCIQNRFLVQFLSESGPLSRAGGGAAPLITG